MIPLSKSYGETIIDWDFDFELDNEKEKSNEDNEDEWKGISE